jgi:Chromosome segregation ATPases
VHILTKVFVLFAAVLSVLMAALAISYSTNADRIRTEYDSAVKAKIAAEGSLAAYRDSDGRKRIEFQREIDTLRQENANLQSRVRGLEAENTQLAIAERQAKASRDSIEGKIAQLGVTVETQAKMIEEYKSEVGSLRSDELRWRNEKLNLESTLSDSESQNLVLTQNLRALQEQLAEAKGSIENLRTGGVALTGGSSGSFEIPGAPVRGTVTEVRTEPRTGDTIVRINLGVNDRVRNNSKLYLNRNGQTYGGDVEIFEADLNFAVGRVRNMQPGFTPRVGDQVWSKLGS